MNVAARCTLAVTSLVAGCIVSTERFAPEYSREYVLAADTKVWTDCQLWTDWYSLNFGGLETVNCFVSPSYDSPVRLWDGRVHRLSDEQREANKKRMITLKKGSMVRIKRIFEIVHQGTSSAELLITDLDSGGTTQVYEEFWSGPSRYLVERRTAQ